jgi:hypothetical protein
MKRPRTSVFAAAVIATAALFALGVLGSVAMHASWHSLDSTTGMAHGTTPELASAQERRTLLLKEEKRLKRALEEAKSPTRLLTYPDGASQICEHTRDGYRCY